MKYHQLKMKMPFHKFNKIKNKKEKRKVCFFPQNKKKQKFDKTKMKWRMK